MKILKSRTFWTIITMFVIGGLQAISDFLPPNLFLFLNGVLSASAVYFKLNPSQQY